VITYCNFSFARGYTKNSKWPDGRLVTHVNRQCIYLDHWQSTQKTYCVFMFFVNLNTSTKDLTGITARWAYFLPIPTRIRIETVHEMQITGSEPEHLSVVRYRFEFDPPLSPFGDLAGLGDFQCTSLRFLMFPEKRNSTINISTYNVGVLKSKLKTCCFSRACD